MSVLEVTDLTVEIPAETGNVLAVDKLSFALEAGEILALVGESGCGKSMSVLSMTGLGPRTATVGGRVTYGLRNLLTTSAKQMRRLRGAEFAYIFQDPMTALNPLIMVGEQVEEVLRLHTSLDRAARAARVIELFDLIGIPSPTERVKLFPHQLSGGMRQRVMIAMAIACDPKVLIADEPTTALDVTVQAQILELLRDLRDRLGMAIIIITHDMGVVADIADRVVVMYAGRAIEAGTVREVLEKPRHPYTRGLLAAVPAPGQWVGEHRLLGIPGSVPVMRASKDLCTFADRCPVALARCTAERPSLSALYDDRNVACWNPQDAPISEEGARDE